MLRASLMSLSRPLAALLLLFASLSTNPAFALGGKNRVWGFFGGEAPGALVKSSVLPAGIRRNDVRGMKLTLGSWRFLSEDPVRGSLNDPMSLQGFTYANVNPTKFSDPNGLWAAGVGIGGGATLLFGVNWSLQLTVDSSLCFGVLASATAREGPDLAFSLLNGTATFSPLASSITQLEGPGVGVAGGWGPVSYGLGGSLQGDPGACEESGELLQCSPGGYEGKWAIPQASHGRIGPGFEFGAAVELSESFGAKVFCL